MPHAKRTASGVLGGLVGLIGLSAIAGILVTATVTPAIAVSGYAASSAISLFDSLPGALEVDRPMEPTTIYAPTTGDADEEYYELASFYDQNREPVEYDQVSDLIYDALLSSEDPRYYEHGGIDLIGTTRALLSNAVSSGTQGGSSISQQYVKNVQVQACERDAEDQEGLEECYLEATDASGVDGYKRKLQEMRYAISIEQEYSKEQILIGYLNLANFGGSTYGIEAAAQYYFGVSSSDVNLSQAATLAGMVQNPNTYRIDLPNNEANGADNSYAQTTERRDYVLGRMLTEGVITQEQHDQAVEQPIEPNITQRQQGCAAAQGTAYFCEYVKNTILYDDRYAGTFGETTEERSDLLTRGGLEIYTTLDNDLQYQAQQTMQNNTDPSVAGMQFGATTVQLDPKTGNILSLAQNTEFSEVDGAGEGQTSLVYAGDYTHGRSTGFSAGSTYKMFTIIDWLENGRSVNEVLDARAGQTLPMTCNGQNSGPYTTNREDNFNSDGGRIDDVRTFTGLSLNTGFYAMASQLDVCEIHAVATNMGLTLGNDEALTTYPGYQNAFSIVGSMNIAPIDMATAYATVANGGVRCEPTAILRATDAAGSELEVPGADCERVLEANIAATTAYDMEAVMEPGMTGYSANVGDGIATFGKTGTHENIQSWMIQTSTAVTTATWVGNVEGGERDGQGDLFNYGLANLRYQISKENQAAANAKYGGEDFPEPDPELLEVEEKNVPDVNGMTVDEATAALQREGFRVTVGDEVPGNADQGRVESTNPSGAAPTGSLVTLNISNGEGAIEVPDVTGMTPARAVSALQDAGLQGTLGSCTQDDGARGQSVTASSPGEGEIVGDGTTVTIDWEARNCSGNDTGDDEEDGGNGGNNGRGNGNDD
ncbi:transglycosylase domain-containing protein [Microbacterium excoecariae]|uniref:transglycosylase domain-containing protein n=1 Tax=Microbacterium excoecariae TaxID=2715210 RepID=UPI0014075408|nr:transglycosylase domain-containing protein [Microbacterium excoecariae]NHI17565.1 PASTA domain-containing protein [Microbacterium excoecariae]